MCLCKTCRITFELLFSFFTSNARIDNAWTFFHLHKPFDAQYWTVFHFTIPLTYKEITSWNFHDFVIILTNILLLLLLFRFLLCNVISLAICWDCGIIQHLFTWETRTINHRSSIGYVTFSSAFRILKQNFTVYKGERWCINKQFEKRVIHFKIHFSLLASRIGKIYDYNIILFHFLCANCIWFVHLYVYDIV